MSRIQRCRKTRVLRAYGSLVGTCRRTLLLRRPPDRSLKTMLAGITLPRQLETSALPAVRLEQLVRFHPIMVPRWAKTYALQVSHTRNRSRLPGIVAGIHFLAIIALQEEHTTLGVVMPNQTPISRDVTKAVNASHGRKWMPMTPPRTPTMKERKQMVSAV